MSKDAREPTLDDILDLAIEVARRHTAASPELAAALREYDADLQCAWKKTAPLWVPNEVAAIRPRQRRGRPKRIASGAARAGEPKCFVARRVHEARMAREAWPRTRTPRCHG